MNRFLKTVFLAISLALALNSALTVFAASDIESLRQYEKKITYVADLEHGLFDDDPNWDLLNEVNVSEGAFYGFPVSASGEYGIGFKHRTGGIGKTVIAACIKIPEEKSGVIISLRLSDYTDSRKEPKGIRIWLGAGGETGLYDPVSRKLAAQNTGYSFSEGRKIYVEDDADANVITVYVDDAGQKVKTMECVIGERKAELRYEKAELTPLTLEYGYDVYKDGYISLTSGVMKTYFSDISVTLTAYSAEAYQETAETVIGKGDAGGNDEDKQNGQNEGEVADSGAIAAKNDLKRAARRNVIIFSCIAAALLISAAVVAAALARTNKKEER